ncbi:hypothetical protein PHYPO_G00044750 [Pangasianodon hypophthalmus]|uniref:Promethin n=1 Tax=Pangasianodon hypophthalmus TaxID=310915 RepID=A0A5N5MHX4_PANHP|nr:lipid droplet assembly factor 1 isoform X1 [Pangasianodon hypophthalmus]XP_053095351.1 lipid droplet assembly factor 1 isoform X1 [Pangasianodon hypophthalmus]XP_053095352.1 lipid droplet assembly factor 1 isoform X1 [Pangasianodon hypophthalmus]KAB5553971.1 hypothetical protein PHYPO_G00044750 [Pangasianodon hypophthalmus]
MEDFKWDPKGHSGSGSDPRNTGHEAGILPEWDPSPSQGTIQGFTHTQGQFRVTSPPTGMFLGDGRKPENSEETQMDAGSCPGVIWIAELLNSKVGKYLSDHPFVTLVLLVFGVTASVPVGLFLAFAAVTFITVTAYCIFAEIVLLTIGGVILLCVLCCLAVVAFWISCVLSVLYIIGSHVLNYSVIPSSVPERTISAGDMEKEKDLND